MRVRHFAVMINRVAILIQINFHVNCLIKKCSVYILYKFQVFWPFKALSGCFCPPHVLLILHWSRIIHPTLLPHPYYQHQKSFIEFFAELKKRYDFEYDLPPKNYLFKVAKMNCNKDKYFRCCVLFTDFEKVIVYR